MLVTLKRFNNNIYNSVCMFSHNVYNKLKLSSNKQYKIKVGQITKEVYVYPGENFDNDIYLSDSIFKSLLINEEVPLNIYKKKDTIILGPVIGVFVNDRYIKKIKRQEPPQSCKKHFQANEAANCLLYYFTFENINWPLNKVKGMFYSNVNEKWTQKWFPLPNVVYDRGVHFPTEEKLLVFHIRNQIKNHPNMHFINNKDYLDKWHTLKRLLKYSDINHMIPGTVRYDDFDTVRSMLENNNILFLKSFYGSLGKEVLSIEKNQDYYELTYYNKTQEEESLVEEKLYYLDELNVFITNFFKEKKFIIQQGISLMKYQNRKFDMRILLVKNIHDEWIALYNQARLAQGDFNITNAATGADVLNYSYIYKKIKQNENLPTDEHVRKVAIEIALKIEKEYGKFGEIGVDLGIDENGKLWFIEANSKPDKVPEPKLEDTTGIAPQCLSILEYSKYLTGMR